MDFQKKLSEIIKKNNSLLCVGLDPDPSKTNNIFDFNKSIIDLTSELVCAYKPNIAFYEAAGIVGLRDLKKTIEYLKSNFPQIPIILDSKRGDVPNTAAMYAKSVFEYWQADAATVYPHLGYDSVQPFLNYEDKFTILLLKTSNPDSGSFQNLPTTGKPYYLKMAEEINKWPNENFGIFCGATYPQELSSLRKIFPTKVFLSAGIGAQSAEISAAVKAGIDKEGSNIMFNSSRSIIYSQDPKLAAQNLRDEINKYK